MNVISKRCLKQEANKHPETMAALENLYRIARKAAWQGLHQVREQFPSADQVGSVLIFTGAYLMEKTRGQRGLNLTLRLLSFVPMAVPGLVLGLGDVFFFNLNGNPLHVLYGSMTLLVVCTIALYLTTAQMTSTTALRQLDSDFEAAALSLKAPLYRH